MKFNFFPMSIREWFLTLAVIAIMFTFLYHTFGIPDRSGFPRPAWTDQNWLGDLYENAGKADRIEITDYDDRPGTVQYKWTVAGEGNVRNVLDQIEVHDSGFHDIEPYFCRKLEFYHENEKLFTLCFQDCHLWIEQKDHSRDSAVLLTPASVQKFELSVDRFKPQSITNRTDARDW